jgi:hypothetical protein
MSGNRASLLPMAGALFFSLAASAGDAAPGVAQVLTRTAPRY